MLTKVNRYRIYSSKKINDAIDEIILGYNKNELRIDDSCYTIKWMKKILSS